MNTSQNKIRYYYLDVLKVFAILFVVLYHHGATPLFPSFLSHIIPVLSVCAPMFFFVNGALLFNKDFDIKKHVKKSLKLFFIIIFWSFFIVLFLMIIRGEKLSLYQFFDNIIYHRMWWTHYFWFFRALLIIYIIFPLLKLLFDAHRNYFYFITLFLLILSVGESFFSSISLFLNDIFGENIVSDFVIGIFDYIKFYSIEFQNFTYAIALFMVGGVFHLHHEKIKNMFDKKNVCVKSLFVFLMFSIIVLMSIGLDWYAEKLGSTDAVWTGMSSWFTLVNILCFAVISCALIRKQIKPIESVSSCTMTIFVLHILVQELVRLIFDTQANYWICLVCYIITFAVSYGISYVINKFKYSRWFVKF